MPIQAGKLKKINLITSQNNYPSLGCYVNADITTQRKLLRLFLRGAVGFNDVEIASRISVL